MKRIVATMLALAMLLGTAAFAADYTVKSGDTLAKIAKSELGDASRWNEIYEANKDTIKDPNKIMVGQTLTIPGGEAAKPSTGTQTPAPSTPVIPTEGIEYEADIVIVGAGGAGLLAAYTASEGGAKVIVMEKAANALSSNFSRCGGPAGAETIVAQRQGVTTTNKEVFDHLYDFANTTVDAKLLWEVWNRAGVAINEMVGLGIPFRNVNEDTYGVGYLARHSFGVGGANRVGPLLDAIEANGGQFLYSTPGEHIIMENGKAVGVTGTNADGETVIVRAKAVMTCTGGFQGDEEMLHERFGDINVISLGSNTPTGDGIRMVLEAGGQLDRNFGVLGDEFKSNNTKAVGSNDNLVFWLYGGLYVDRDGDRFINEKLVADFPLALGGEAILRQGKVYAVMDETYYKACTTEGEGIINFLGDPADWASKVGLRAQNGLTNAPGQLQKAIDEGWAIKTDTLAEAAAYFGLENLEKTVAEYNEMCAKGEDHMFNKSPNFLTPVKEGPFYVFEYEPAAWSTFGGVKTDSYLRAVGANGDVIPGLYAGGCEVGSYYAVPYFDGPGSCVGIAVGSGVWAAENMLAYIGKLADEPTYKTGNHSASVNGFGGPVTVTLTVAADKIINVFVDGADETPTVGGAILGTLANRAKATGKVDTVAGATITSGAAQVAYAKALALATDVTPAKTPVKDGTYTATAPGFSWTGMITCDVTFKDGKLTAVDITEEHETETGEMLGMVKSTYIPRMIENQSLAVDVVAGATATSNAIRAIVADAVEQAGGNRADWYDAVAKKTDTVKLEGYDVIVVGMGGSGMLSFCAAADQGAKVIGLEKGGKLGGNSTTTTGPMALNSKYLNNGEPYIDEDDVFNTWMEYVDGKKEEVVRRAVYESTEALEYYIEKFDFAFDGLILSFVKPEWNKLWTRYVNDPATEGPNKLGPNKTYMYQRAVDKAMDLSEGSEYMLETTVTKMLTDDDGNVIGVEAVNVDGTTYQVYGKTVILATGGYIANADMMVEQFGTTTQTLGCTLCTGDGIKLGQSVGGATYALDVLPMIHIEQVPNLIKNDDLTGEEKAILSALALVRGQRAVNIYGEAFDRNTDAAAECYVPGFRYFTVYTQEEIDGFRANGLPENFAAATSHFLGQGTFTTGTPVASIDKILSVGQRYGNVISGSIADLAAGIGCDAETLTATLGEDGKYYAVICAGYAYATVGGLDIDENMNVLKEDGTPIANLFAVGQDSQGVCNVSGKAYSPWGGQAQSWTFLSGRIAGQQAAKVAGK